MFRRKPQIHISIPVRLVATVLAVLALVTTSFLDVHAAERDVHAPANGVVLTLSSDALPITASAENSNHFCQSSSGAGCHSGVENLPAVLHLPGSKGAAVAVPFRMILMATQSGRFRPPIRA